MYERCCKWKDGGYLTPFQFAHGFLPPSPVRPPPFYFIQLRSISSSVFPLVSGTNTKTKTSETAQRTV